MRTSRAFAIALTLGLTFCLIAEAATPVTALFRCGYTGQLMRACCCTGQMPLASRGTCATVGAPGCCELVPAAINACTSDRVPPQRIRAPQSVALALAEPSPAFACSPLPGSEERAGDSPPDTGPLYLTLRTLRV